MPYSARKLLCLSLLLTVLSSVCSLDAISAEPRNTGPWNLNQLKKAPAAQWGETSGLVQEVYYQGEPYRGKPTRVFAYYARPAEGDGPFPAMVLVHGGGGTAFAEWATLWAKRGYVALAMDLAGRGPGRKRLSDGGPDQTGPDKFRDFTDDQVRDMWTYHAVASAIRGHSLLAARQEVDSDRIGVTGISWGGYLTCIIAGLDDRLKVAAPVYGCGFLHHNSAWLAQFAKMSPTQKQRWVTNFDPSMYLPGVRCPTLFVNGTNDFAYPLDSYQKSYRAAPAEKTLCVTVRMPHGHPAGWAPQEIGLFVDSVLTGGVPLAQVGKLTIDGQTVTASFQSSSTIVSAQWHTTTDVGIWKERKWKSVEANVDRTSVSAALSAQRPLVGFMTLRDQRGAIVSTEHIELAAE